MKRKIEQAKKKLGEQSSGVNVGGGILDVGDRLKNSMETVAANWNFDEVNMSAAATAIGNGVSYSNPEITFVADRTEHEVSGSERGFESDVEDQFGVSDVFIDEITDLAVVVKLKL